MATDLLPPNATPLERALAGATSRIDAIPVDVQNLWDPASCPILLLPWLAWAFSTDQWEPSWSDAEKRAAVAGAIEFQRHKGTRWSVEQVLSRFDDLLQLVEWFEATPRLDPHVFEVRLPLIDGDGVAGGARVTAAFAQAIVTEVAKAKPVREHMVLVQQLELAALATTTVAVETMGFVRLDGDTADESGIDWETVVTDDLGEPLSDDFDEVLEDDS
ncbi:MAG: phage tail protein I [Pseudomonadota bacterium]